LSPGGAPFAPFRERALVEKVSKEIGKAARGDRFRIMHVCGTHEWAITHAGLRELLPEGVEVVAGPGCPVCVTPGGEIDALADLAAGGRAAVTTFGDVVRVPGARSSLAGAKAAGGDVRVVYGMADAIRMARSEPSKEFVHFSIGFETTAPMAALEVGRGLPANLSIFSTHKLIPPALDFLLRLGIDVDGFICPGHVSTIIGADAYGGLAKEYGKPMVVTGFEPLDVMLGVLEILEQKRRGAASVANRYGRAVSGAGNEVAMEAMRKVFEPADAEWRGIGKIPGSGLRLRKEYGASDAALRFGIGDVPPDRMPEGCGCGQVLLGRLRPEGCALFNKRCRPESPVGPCMVSLEGTCAIAYKYRAKK
jgi:hydrogenase expression/formation protein HypD